MSSTSLLDGLKIVDFSALLPGPYGTVLLADLGADVIKVEPPTGDMLRHLPFDMVRVANRNKRSLVLDLKNAAAREVAGRLAAWADIVVEGSRPGVAERMGIGPERLRAIHPKLVYCSISGFGQTGPWRLRAGHDISYLAASGALAYPGSAADTRPRRSGLPVSDLAGSLYFAVAALAAWARAQKTGVGATLDLSLTEAAMSFASVRGDFNRAEPNLNYLMPGNDTFATADGRWMALGLIEPVFWDHFVAAAGDVEPRLCSPAYATLDRRLGCVAEVSAVIADAMRQRDAAAWTALFEHHDVPGHTVLSPAEASATEQAVARGLLREIDGERHLPFPVHVDGEPGGSLRTLAPALGAHTSEVLQTLGYDAGGIARLLASGACEARASTGPK